MLSNGEVGVYFNDADLMIGKPEDNNITYMKRGKKINKNLNLDNYDEYDNNTQKKITLIQRGTANIQPVYNIPIENTENIEYLGARVYLQKWIRPDIAYFLRFNNGTLQIIFEDGECLILYNHGQVITYINNNNNETRTLSTVDAYQTKNIADKLYYVRDMLKELIDKRGPLLKGNDI